MGRLLLAPNSVLPLLLISFTFGFPEAPTVSGHSISLQSLVLEGLGLSEIPDMSKANISQEEYSRMYNEYLESVDNSRKRQTYSDIMDSSIHSTVHRLVTFRHTGGVKASNNTTWLYFPVTLNDAYFDIEKATLKMFLSVSSNTTVNVTIQVYQVLETGKRLVLNQSIDLKSSKWIDLDLTEAVESWNNGKSKNLGLEIRCLTGPEKSVVLLTGENNRGNDFIAPALNILVNEKVFATRNKRADEDSFPDTNRRTDCSKDNHRQRCCRHKMEVIFKDLPGFEFIIQPFRFDAGFCKGRCPPRYNPAHHHAVIQSLMWEKNKTRTPRPCCSASKLANLEILHVDEKILLH